MSPKCIFYILFCIKSILFSCYLPSLSKILPGIILHIFQMHRDQILVKVAIHLCIKSNLFIKIQHSLNNSLYNYRINLMFDLGIYLLGRFFRKYYWIKSTHLSISSMLMKLNKLNILNCIINITLNYPDKIHLDMNLNIFLNLLMMLTSYNS